MTLPRMLPKRRRRDNRVRCQGHRTWVARHSCCVPGCDATVCEASHVSEGVPLSDCAGQGMKSGDNWTWSLCHGHHVEFDAGERKFCTKYQVDAVARAQEFAENSQILRRYYAKQQRSVA